MTEPSKDPRPRIAVVIHRFGKDVGGGAENHARLLATCLSSRYDVEVVTTCARDHHSWKNHYDRGVGVEDGLCIRRFATARTKNRALSFLLSRLLFKLPHPALLERLWLRILGPHSPDLLTYLEKSRSDYDAYIFYTYLYPTTVHGLPPLTDRALLISTAHDEPMLYLKTHRALVNRARAFGFLTPEEGALVLGLRDASAPAPVEVVLGTDIEVPDRSTGTAFQEPSAVDVPFFLYLGRIERSKGCAELFRLWKRRSERLREAELVLVGKKAMRIPRLPGLRYLGFVEEARKATLLDSCQALIQPSRRESLSLVALEAWARGRPVLAHSGCAALRGQIERSGAGRIYSNQESFDAELGRMCNYKYNKELGDLGRAWVKREYAPGSLLQKLESLFLDLGWFEKFATTHRTVEKTEEKLNV